MRGPCAFSPARRLRPCHPDATGIVRQESTHRDEQGNSYQSNLPTNLDFVVDSATARASFLITTLDASSSRSLHLRAVSWAGLEESGHDAVNQRESWMGSSRAKPRC